MSKLFRLKAVASTTPVSTMEIYTTDPFSLETLALFAPFHQRFVERALNVRYYLNLEGEAPATAVLEHWQALFYAYVNRRATHIRVHGVINGSEVELLLNEKFVPGLCAIGAIRWCPECEMYHPSTTDPTRTYGALKRAIKHNDDPRWQPSQPLAAEAHGA